MQKKNSRNFFSTHADLCTQTHQLAPKKNPTERVLESLFSFFFFFNSKSTLCFTNHDYIGAIYYNCVEFNPILYSRNMTIKLYYSISCTHARETKKKTMEKNRCCLNNLIFESAFRYRVLYFFVCHHFHHQKCSIFLNYRWIRMTNEMNAFFLFEHTHRLNAFNTQTHK